MLKRAFSLILVTIIVFSPDYVLGKQVSTVVESSAILPLRDTFEGLNFKVDWNDMEKSVTIIDRGKEFKFRESKDLSKYKLDDYTYATIIVNGKSYFSIDVLEDIGLFYKIKKGRKIEVSNREIDSSKKIKKFPKLNMIDKKKEKIILDESILEDENLVVFWASWCEGCKSSLEVLKVMEEELSKSGVRLILIGVKDSFSLMDEILEDIGLDYDQIYLANSEEIKRELRISRIPASYFIKDAEILGEANGVLSQDTILSGIEEAFK